MKKDNDKIEIEVFTDDVDQIVNTIVEGLKSNCIDRSVFEDSKFECSSKVDFFETITSEKIFTEKYDNVKSAYDNRKEKALIDKLKAYDRRRIIKLKFIKYSAAAALFAISVLCYNYYNDFSNSEIIALNKTVIDKEVTTVINTPVLISANSEIKLSSKHDVVDVKKYAIEDRVVEQQIIIPRGFTKVIVLEDGTEVILNAESSLKYPSKFSKNIREVIVEGEAFFKVSKSNIPFVVKVNDVAIKVYGTSFNVKSRDNSISTVLVSGSVGISGNEINEILLKPNQLAVYDENNKSCKVENIDVYSYTAWIDNKFVFEGSDIDFVINELERWYDVDIKYNKNNFKDSYLNMSFSRDSKFDEVIDILEKTFNLLIIAEGGNQYYIRD